MLKVTSENTMTINDEKVPEIYKEFGDSDIKIENIEER